MKIIRVGRGSTNDIVVNDPHVSRVHCEFIKDENGDVRVNDLNSANGTYINGVRRSGQTRLKNNDIVRIGNSTLPWQNYFGGSETKTDRGGTIVDPPYPYTPAIPPTTKPSNWLVPAILSTICCSMLFGIISIVHASRVDNRWAMGDYDGAIESARKAKTWFWVGFGIGLFTKIVSLIILILGS